MSNNGYRRAKFWLAISIMTFVLGAVIVLVKTEGTLASAPTTDLKGNPTTQSGLPGKSQIKAGDVVRNNDSPHTTPIPTPTAICPGSWTFAASYPLPVMDHSLVEQDGMLYSFSGVVSDTVSPSSYKYDPSADTWTAIAPLPSARRNASAVSNGTYIYILSGSDITGTVTNSLFRYDRVTNTYATLASAPTATEDQTAVYVIGKIYKIGGDTGAGDTNAVEIYDIASNTWISSRTNPGRVLDFPHNVKQAMSVVFTPYVYVAGGLVGGQATDEVYRCKADSVTACIDGWEVGPPDIIPNLPTKRWGSNSFPMKGMWYIENGSELDSVGNTVLAKNTIKWDPNPQDQGQNGPNSWEPGDPPPIQTKGSSGASSGIAGYDVGGAGSSNLNRPMIQNTNQRFINNCQTGGNTIANLRYHDGTRENRVGNHDPSGMTQTAAIWLERFTPRSDYYPLTLNAIHIYWPDQPEGQIVGLTVRLLVYSDPDGDGDPANAVSVSQITATVGITEADQSYPVNIPMTGTGDIYIGFEDYWAEQGYVPALFPAALDTNASQERAWVAAMDNGDPPDLANLGANDTLTIIDKLGLPGNWMISARASIPAITPTPTSVIHGHLTWQGVAAANRPAVTGTLTLCVSGTPTAYSFTTNTAGKFTVTTSLPDGIYHWMVRGGRHITNSSPTDGTALVITGASAAQEFGTQNGGNTNPQTDNIVNAQDFNTLRAEFGQAGLKASDFDYNSVVNAQDFNILKNNFGQAGHSLTCP